MTVGPESLLSRSLREVLEGLPVGADIPASDRFREALLAMTYFVPVVLGEIHSEWRFLGLDGIEPVVARKTDVGEAEVFGVCCFVSDQSITPLDVHLQIASASDDVAWLECGLGEQTPTGMLREPYRNLKSMANRLRRLYAKNEQISWVYHVTFGLRHT
jgi:hypothetical protein